ncbi:DNA-3-methyladenine glycosylase family protein [Gloeothece verrucosa]|uniref:DNA-3-methyladenine glycosylase II n=1 Tax=Gloeothece verrucosa (strain PCC 7822) TaxID=497965 RepID=E0U5Q3_GLOV7|nr:DNA-3-methyladenine glycosylase [Gloeothece verrucosa]ADN15894.1 HhH-GPD family protein [Gloeothece verrucosa PCC 7822]
MTKSLINYDQALYYLQEADIIMAQIISEIGDYQLAEFKSNSSLLEALAWAIMAQQISTEVANKIYQRFLSLYNESTPLNARNLLQTSDEDLRSIGISRYKIGYLKNLARAVEEYLPPLSELATMEDETIIKLLTQIKGIGTWTVQMLLIFRLQRLDILPSGDLGIRMAIKNLYQLPELPSPEIVEAIGHKWKPYRTIAAWYLWRSLSDTIEKIQF